MFLNIIGLQVLVNKDIIMHILLFYIKGVNESSRLVKTRFEFTVELELARYAIEPSSILHKTSLVAHQAYRTNIYYFLII